MGRQAGGLQKDAKGQFYRQIGRKRNVAGQAKFRLGSDISLAQIAYAKLGRLWKILADEHGEHQSRSLQLQLGNPSPQLPALVWPDEALAIAEAIRKHQNEVYVGIPEHIEGDAAYVMYIAYLRQRFGTVVMILPADADAAERGKAQHAVVSDHRARQAKLSANYADIPIPAGLIGQTFYQAIDAFAAKLENSSTSESTRVEVGHVRRLKHSLQDTDLSQLNSLALEKIRNYWASRPLVRLRSGKLSNRRLSLSSVDNHITVARRFFKWLDRSDEFQWELPRHGLEELKINLSRLRTEDEVARTRHGVRTFKVEDLAVIYAHATDLERLLILLALNCAMAQGEIITLRWDEIETFPPAIKRIRRKTKVYGEFALWEETVAALTWWRSVRPVLGDLVMMTGNSRPCTRQHLSNIWVKLPHRIGSHSDKKILAWHSFKFLRKTSAQLVRNVSDGEVAAVLLSHGQPVETDHLSDAYSNRPFDKVAAALEKVRQQLMPMFAAAPNAYESKSTGGRSKRLK